MPTKSEYLLYCWVAFSLSVSVGVSADISPLVDAAKNKDRGGLTKLLKQGAAVNSAEADGSSALHWAVHWDDPEMVVELLHAGARVNVTTDLGITPLFLACVNGDTAMVEGLLNRGANPNINSQSGESPLMAATRTSSLEAIQALIAHGANVNAKEKARSQTVLMWAVAAQRPDIVKLLLAHGADIRARSMVVYDVIVRDDRNDESIRTPRESIARGGSTALLFAARQGDLESARLLVAAGANVNETAPDEMSGLVMAAFSGHGAFAEFLLDNGADPNADGAGLTAMHAAALTGDLNLTKALVAHGANLNAPLKRGTPVTRFGDEPILPNYLTGATPYLVAAKFLGVEIMEFLVSKGANPLLKTSDGTTALMLAADRRLMANRSVDAALHERDAPKKPHTERRLETILLTLKQGADINAANNSGNTALHLAAARGSDEVIQLLVDRGAKPDVMNKLGQTPLIMAATHKRTADLLRKLGDGFDAMK
jgi:ankyrin repeat protein